MLVQHCLQNSSARIPEKTALICGHQRLTYQEIDELSDRLAAGLIALGIKRQNRVCVLLDNSVESVISLFGILKAGGVFSILSATMKSSKLKFILRDSGARVLITHTNKARVVRQAFADASELEHIVWCGVGGRLDLESVAVPSFLWSAILERTEVRKECFPDSVDVDLATIIYTSGSTGKPKGVMSAHYNMISAARSIIQYLENEENDIILSCLPLSFDYGLYQVLMAFMFGGTVVLEKSFVYPYKVIERLVQERATAFPVVPTILAVLLQMDDLLKHDFGSLRYISNTAAALPVQHIERLRALLPQVKIYSMYGLTECKRVSYLPPQYLNEKPKSVGIPMPNEEVFIVDNDGKETRIGEVGELVVRGSNVMQGYWNAPEETARVFRPGRYIGEVLLYTGDLFHKDTDGFLYFVARKDDMIKTKGERVSPREIENVLHEIEGVSQAVVIGVPDLISGQAIKAIVVPRKASFLNKREVLRYCKENLEHFMIPKYTEFRESMPRLSNGKIDKKALQRNGFDRRKGMERRKTPLGNTVIDIESTRDRRHGKDRRSWCDRRIALAV